MARQKGLRTGRCQGCNHLERVRIVSLGAWSHPETWDMLQFGLRLGGNPRCLVATTPRPTRLIRELLAREGRDVAVTRGSTYENRANLAPGFFDQVIRKYEGTRLGRQELNAELLEDTPGALWSPRYHRSRAPGGSAKPGENCCCGRSGGELG